MRADLWFSPSLDSQEAGSQVLTYQAGKKSLKKNAWGPLWQPRWISPVGDEPWLQMWADNQISPAWGEPWSQIWADSQIDGCLREESLWVTGIKTNKQTDTTHIHTQDMQTHYTLHTEISTHTYTYITHTQRHIHRYRETYTNMNTHRDIYTRIHIHRHIPHPRERWRVFDSKDI